MRGQRGSLRALTGICHVHESYSLFLRKSVFRDVRMRCCLAIRFLVKGVHFVCHYMKYLLFFQTSDRGWPACGRLGRQTSARAKTSARLKITFVDMTYPKGWTGSLPLCPLIFSWHHRWEIRVSRDAQNVCAVTIVGTVLNSTSRYG